MTAPRLVVVGAGPAGLSAAMEAREHGSDVSVIEENSWTGGQYFRGRPDSTAPGSPRKFARHVGDMELILGSAVIDAVSGRLTIAQAARRPRQVSYDGLVIATGAYDRPVAMPGWTLPGVITGGGAHTLAKAFHVKPGTRVIVSGAGPFLPQLASALAIAGSHVVVCEATGFATALQTLAWLSRDRAVLRQAIVELAALARARIRIKYRRIVTAITGEDRVTGAVVQAVDRDWRPLPGTATSMGADAVCLAFGFVPNLDLPQLLGCGVRYDPRLCTYSVVTDSGMRTTQAGIYAAGEIAGIGGARLAAARGRLAGLTFAHDAGLVTEARYSGRLKTIANQVVRLNRIADRLNQAYRPGSGLWSLANESTLVCRCEEVTAREAELALEHNSRTPAALKAATRAGMGPCQGKMCTPFLTEWLRSRHGYSVPADVRPWSVRPPIRPTRISDMLE
jgi:D-hydroxyproline dehydrogenase subunit alpha